MYPGYLEQGGKRKVFGRKTSVDVPSNGFVEMPASAVVSFLRSCVPPVPGVDGVHTQRGAPMHLYNRVGVDALLGTKKRRLFSWPDLPAYVHKPAPPPPPQTAPLTDGASMLPFLALATAAEAALMAAHAGAEDEAERGGVPLPLRPTL